MKIYDRNLTGTSASETGQAQEAQNLNRTGRTTSPTRNGVDGSNDRVEFSGTLGQLSRALTSFETSRAQRVQALAADSKPMLAIAHVPISGTAENVTTICCDRP